MTSPNPLMVPAPNPPGGASASAVLRALRAAGVTHVVTVPDFVQFALHAQLAAADAGIAQVYACSEDQALTVAAGLYVGGAKPVVLVQNGVEGLAIVELDVVTQGEGPLGFIGDSP